jgi:RhtB (resistance to homoserine/threonine) family protein
MFGITHFTTFLITGILLNITPGSDTMYILGRSISQGKKAGIASVLGISTGSLIHTLLAGLGLSVIIAQSPFVFNVIKYLGAIYLCFLGVKMLFNSANADFNVQKIDEKLDLKKIYYSGILTNVLNPKVALFFLAFLPQFVQNQYISNPLPFFLLGLTFVFTGTVWCLILALFSSLLANKIKKNYAIKQWIDRTTGIVFIAIGLKLALEKSR